jgi:hypothetical protein
LIRHVLALVAAVLVVAIAVRLVLIEAVALRLVTVAMPQIVVAILIAAGGALSPLLIFMSLLVGHDIPPRRSCKASDVPRSRSAAPDSQPRADKVAVLQLDTAGGAA